MAKKESPKWVKDDCGIDCIEYRGIHWYLNYYGRGVSFVYDVGMDLSSAAADKEVVEEFIKEHPCPAA